MNPNQQPTMPQQQGQGQQFTSGHNQIYDKLRGVLLNLHAQGVPGMDKVLNALHQTHVSQLKPPTMPQQQGQQPNPLLGAAAGAQGMVENPPKFTFANNMNPILNQAINADQVQGLLNTPSDSMQSAGALGKDMITPGTQPMQYASDAFGAAQLPLLFASLASMGGAGKVGKLLADEKGSVNFNTNIGGNNLSKIALDKFGEVNPSEAGNFKGFASPDGKVINAGGAYGIGDHSDVADKVFGYPQNTGINSQPANPFAQNASVYGFMKEANAPRIYRQADEVGVQYVNPINKNQLNVIGKSLNPDGGTIFWDGPKKGESGSINYSSIKDGITKLKNTLPMISSEKGGINFGALIGNGKQNAYKMPGKAALPGSLGEMQEQAQISRGQPLLASLDRAMRSGDENAVTDVAKQMLADPKYQEYWGTLPDYVKSSIGSSVAPTMPTITQVQDNIFKMLNSMPKQSALNQGIYNAMSQVKL
jgi:hypothetical protein